jgi:branched-chain amino acid transport system substrate-binding protein
MKIILRCILAFLFLTGTSITAAEKIKVGSIFAKSGPATIGGQSAIEGIRFAVQELNDNGGVRGKQIQIVEIDNQSTALGSKLAAEKAVEEDVVIVFGANWSSHSIAMAPVLQRARIPMISPFSTNPDVTQVGDYIFRVCFIDPFQGRIMASFATRHLKAKTAAILTNASGRYSEGLSEYFRQHFVFLGGKVVFSADYLYNTEDFTIHLKEIVKLKPDVVFVPGHIIDSGRIIKQSRGMGIKVPILGGDGWGDAMYDHAGAALDDAYYSDHWHENNENAKSLRFVKNFREEFKSKENAGTALAYDAVYLFADAAARASSLDPTEIRNALAKTDQFEGITGRISFNEFGDPIKPAVIWKYLQGKSMYIKTVEP